MDYLKRSTQYLCNSLVFTLVLAGVMPAANSQTNNKVCTDKSKNCSGIYREFYQNGKVRFETNWLLGKPAPNRLETIFFKDGSKANSKEYKNNKIDGELVRYSEDRVIQEKTKYRDDKKNGPSVTYDDAGKVKDLTNWLNDEKHGEYIEYGENGQPTAKIQYKAGMPEGETTSYYDNGNISQVTEYRHGEKHGDEREMQQNGKRKAVRRYRRGELNGTEQVFDLDGLLSQEIERKNGKRHGPSKIYGEEGVLVQLTTYEDDQAIFEKEYVNGKEVASWKIFPDGSRVKNPSVKKKPVSAGPT